MEGKTRKVIQAVLAVALLAAAVRLVLVFRERSETAGPPATQGRPVDTGLDADAYVVPRRLRAYDLKSARELVGRPAWVKEGYRYTVYPYDGRRVDFGVEAGRLGPIERIQVQDVIQQKAAGVEGEQVLAVFEKEGKRYALPIGARREGGYEIYADEVLYIQDPRELYGHWSEEVWQAIEQRQIKPGMNEMQASFALGMGTPQRSDDPSVKTVVYPREGKPVTVTFRNGRAVEIQGVS